MLAPLFAYFASTFHIIHIDSINRNLVYEILLLLFSFVEKAFIIQFEEWQMQTNAIVYMMLLM